MKKETKRAWGVDRSNFLNVRLSANELKSLKSKANEVKMSKSEYVRSLLK